MLDFEKECKFQSFCYNRSALKDQFWSLFLISGKRDNILKIMPYSDLHTKSCRFAILKTSSQLLQLGLKFGYCAAANKHMTILL